MEAQRRDVTPVYKACLLMKNTKLIHLKKKLNKPEAVHDSNVWNFSGLDLNIIDTLLD